MSNYTSMPGLKPKDTSWHIEERPLSTDISSIIAEVLAFDTEWYLDTSRQDNNLVHKDTKMFQLIYTPYLWQLGDQFIPALVNTLKSPDLLDLYAEIENYYSGKIARCEIIDMTGQADIPTHVDGMEFLTVARRVHVPLYTHENVFFTVMNTTVNMKVGNWYEINNCLPHSVKNNGEQRRIHMILDVLANDHIK